MEIRCQKCNKLLAVDFDGTRVSIKCTRCGTINIIDKTILSKKEVTYRNRVFTSK
jgi:phage FluMu protein Com